MQFALLGLDALKMRRMKSKRVVGFILIVLFLACNSNAVDEEKSAIVDLDEIPELSIFHLPGQWTSHKQQSLELKDLHGDVLVMVMIYTSCKAACPRLIADMNDIESQIDPLNLNDVKLILVSIDPETDTPQKMLEFSKENFMEEDHWIFLNGSEDDVRSLANVLAMKYKRISPIDFSHSNIISVFDQQGVLQHQQEGLGVNNAETITKINELLN